MNTTITKKETKKLSLDAFKQKAKVRNDVSLEKITGGILGSCHCVTYGAGTTWVAVYCVYKT